MPVEKKKLSCGIRYRYRKMVKGKWIRSPFVFITSADAATAEADAVHRYQMPGKIPSISSDTSAETVHQLLTRRLQWLKEHRSPKHAKDNEYLFSQALKYSPEWANKPASEITLEEAVKWAEKWAADLQARKKSRVTVNKALIALQSAWNCPWGSRTGPLFQPPLLVPLVHLQARGGQRRPGQDPEKARPRNHRHNSKIHA